MVSHSRSRRPQYNGVKERRRIIAAILSLAVVLIAISEARRPENWKWLAPGPSDADRQATSRTEPVPDALAPDQVRIVSTPETQVSRAGLREQHQPEQASLRIPAEYLDAVEESRVGVRATELPAYFAMLSTARDANPRELSASARRDLPFLSLMNDPAEHRGEVIWIEGELRRVERLEAGPNDKGFEQLYEGWLFTDEAGRTNPYRIVVSELPDGFPQGTEVRERVRLPAYFFKRYTYATAHGQHSAPMLIGSRWARIVGRREGTSGDSSPGWWPFAIALIAAGWVGLQIARLRLASPRRPQHAPIPAPDFAAPPETSAPALDPREFLGQLAEQEERQS
jgi:hypothetical protein